MFQYAAGRSLALKNACQFKIDLSGFDTYSLHNGYELDNFNIIAEIASPKEVQSLAGTQSKLAKHLMRRLGMTKNNHFIEREFYFNPNFFQVRQPVYLDGYWQSYQYPKSCETYIRDEFTFICPPNGLNLELFERIKSSNSVSIHVRRGDYLTNPTFSGVHGFVGIEYYQKSIHQVLERIESPSFFVFSDDIEWAKHNLGINNSVCYVSHNTGRSSFQDMQMMSMCEHNIIANSSFSWWAAWLNANPNKVVTAPVNWLANRSVVPNYDKFIDSLFPDDWVLI